MTQNVIIIARLAGIRSSVCASRARQNMIKLTEHHKDQWDVTGFDGESRFLITTGESTGRVYNTSTCGLSCACNLAALPDYAHFKLHPFTPRERRRVLRAVRNHPGVTVNEL